MTTPSRSATAPRPWTDPPIIQGGMGVAVSGWRLARAVAEAGQLGVISGTAIETVHARRLADGDAGGHLQRAYRSFPVPEVAERVLEQYLRPAGRDGTPYPNVGMFTTRSKRSLVELTVLATYAEVWLAREGHKGLVGINLLEKVQLPTVYALYGALLAGVDAVLMGAGIPKEIPATLRALVAGDTVRYPIHVERGEVPASDGDEPATVEFSPTAIFGTHPELAVPRFLAIVSSHTLATFLARDPVTRPDGFVIEHHRAGGHNAPPRRGATDEHGQPAYGERDEANLRAVAATGLPFWLAGGCGAPGHLDEARRLGAAGVQVGTAFACCEESGLDPDLKRQVIDSALAEGVRVRTDPRASPTGFPFKIVELEGTLSDPEVLAARERVCDLGYLRTPYRRSDGSIGYRCPGEPQRIYLRKGGDLADTAGRVCLCNGLLAAAGHPQSGARRAEPPVVTAGTDLERVVVDLAADGPYHASDVIDYLLCPAP
jgi:NAD(P)H-dependent flavin oxidoreductase YrpB (nitropropane dioxygenase family)